MAFKRILEGSSKADVAGTLYSICKQYDIDVDETLTWSQARERVNIIAEQLDVPSQNIYQGLSGGVSRALVNDILDAMDVPDGASMYLDFTNENYIGGDINFSRLSEASFDPDGGPIQMYAQNVMRRDGRGALLEMGRTNKCENWNANPTDLTNMVVTGDVAATLTVVDDSAELAAAGLSEVCTTGMVFRLDNSAGTSGAIAGLFGSAGNLNQHIGSAWVRGGAGSISASASADGSRPFEASSVYQRRTVSIVPTEETRFLTVRANAGHVVYFILNQLEEGSFATSPSITEGAQAARAGDLLRVTVPDGPRAFVLDMDLLEPVSTGSTVFLANWSDGTSANRYTLFKSDTGAVQLVTYVGGSSLGTVSGVGFALPGRNIAYGVAASGYQRHGLAGASDGNATTFDTTGQGLNTLAVGGAGYITSNNIYMRSRQFAEFHNFTDPEAAFAQVKALAQEWAAQ